LDAEPLCQRLPFIVGATFPPFAILLYERAELYGIRNYVGTAHNHSFW